MQRASRISMLVASLLGCGCVLADDSDIRSFESLLDTNYAVPLDVQIPSETYRAIDALEFHDNSTLGRLKRLRDVSFLTIAESGQSRIFLGIDSDGVVGLHFRIR